MQRTLQPELLDSLPHDHPDAVHNRRDLRLTNHLVGNHRWLEARVARLMIPGENALELGAGTGELGHRLARRGVRVTGLDLWPRPSDWPADLEWCREDLRTFGRYEDFAIVIGNLIFHQFSESELAAIGARLAARARVIIAAEPERRRASQILYRLLAPILRLNRVSLHDAHVSIAAGFRGLELPRALHLSPSQWNIRCTTTWRGMYRMVAVRAS